MWGCGSPRRPSSLPMWGVRVAEMPVGVAGVLAHGDDDLCWRFRWFGETSPRRYPPDCARTGTNLSSGNTSPPSTTANQSVARRTRIVIAVAVAASM